jgi:hypothetical protein
MFDNFFYYKTGAAMRRLIMTCIACCIGWVVIGSTAAHGADAVDTAIAQLKAGASVYVEPGADGTSLDTTTALKQALKEDDHIILIMLPAAGSSTDTIDQVVRRIDAATDHKFTIGLTQGTRAIGYSTILPDSVASDAMARAKSIAPNQTEALLTYARVIHDWQTAHPSPTASPPPGGNEKQEDFGWKLALGSVVGAALAVGAIRLFRRRNAGFHARSIVANLNASPPAIRGQLEELLMLGQRVHDTSLQQEITSIATNVNDFFELSRASNRETSDDAKVYAGYLSIIEEALRRYVVIQGKQRLFKDAAGQMEEASAEIKKFGGFVLSSIQRSNEVDLRSFKSSIATLKAFGEIAD